MHMPANTIEAILALALACARSFAEAVTRNACEMLAEQAELLDVAHAPISASADPVSLVAELHCVDPRELSATDRVRFLQRAVAHTAWAESRVNAALLAIAGTSRRVHVVRLAGQGSRLETIEIEDAARSEIALAARWTETQAQSRLDSARVLHHLLPLAEVALVHGEISHAHAVVIAEGASRLAVGIGVDALAAGIVRDGEAWENLAAAAAQLDARATVIAARSNRSLDTAMLRGQGEDDALVPAAEVRDLLVSPNIEVSLRRLITDPLTGHLLDASPRRYAPGERLRDFIEARDVRCRWPGCNARSTGRGIDLDHAVPFDSGGTTQRANLGALCRRHHLLKTHAGFDLTDSDADGSCTLVTPSGSAYSHEAVPMLPAELPPF